MNSLPKQALLCEGMASLLLSRDSGVSQCGGHPHSSPVALGASVLPVLWLTTLAYLLSYRGVPYANSVLGGGFWEPDSLQLCKRPCSLQHPSDRGSRVNRNNHVQILLLDCVEFLPPPLYLSRCLSTHSCTTDREQGTKTAETENSMAAAVWKLCRSCTTVMLREVTLSSC